MDVREAPEEMLSAELAYRRGRIRTWTVDGVDWVVRNNLIVRVEVVREGIAPEPWTSVEMGDIDDARVLEITARLLRGETGLPPGNGKIPEAFRPLVESCDRFESIGSVFRLFRGDLLVGIVTEIRAGGDGPNQFHPSEVIR